MSSTAPHPASTCSYVLDNGQPCRGPALRDFCFCRHHTRKALARRHSGAAPHPADGAVAGPAANPSANPAAPHEATTWELRACWRTHHRVIARSSDPEDLDDTLATILNALAQHKISPTSAGRLLQAILDRKRELQLAAQQAAFRAVQQAYLRRIRPQAAPAAV